MSRARQRPNPRRPAGAPVDFETMLRTGALKPAEQLEFVLQFLREELSEANATMWSSRLKGLPLRPVVSESGRLKIQWQMAVSYDALDVARLRRLQVFLHTGIRALVSSDQRQRAWPLPRPEGLVMAREQDGSCIWQYSHTDTAKGDEGALSLVGLAAAQLFAEHADRVRACAWCQTIFLAVKRQQYCTGQHAQLARDQKKKSTRATTKRSS